MRSSNIELLRIISMFLVLIVHADYFSLGAPTVAEITDKPISSFTRIFFESLSILCVNVFVFISGWFSIKPSFKRVINFVFQCLFFLIGIYIVCLCLDLTQLSLKGIAGCFFMLRWNWFIKAYLCLMIVAPIMNLYVEKTSEKQLRILIINFYIFQTIYGWLTHSAVFFNDGYSTLSFMGIYLLSRYIRLYPNRLTTLSKKGDITIFMSIILLQAIVAFYIPSIGGYIMHYLSPLVIISTIYLFLFFSKLNFTSVFINEIGLSSFAVFLLHTNPNLCNQYFKPFVLNIFESYNSINVLIIIFIFLLAIFAVSVLIDRMRLYLWRFLWSYILEKLYDKYSRQT